MTRIAVISDAHSNIPATAAVLRHIENNRIDHIYSIGDMIGKGPSPCEVVDLHQKHCDISILGNWEDFILNSGVSGQPIDYYRARLSDAHLDFLKGLGYTIEFYLSGSLFRIFHAHPNNVYRRIFRKVPLQSHAELFVAPTFYETSYPHQFSDVVIYGDIHYPYEILFDEKYFKQYFKDLGHSVFKTYSDFQNYNFKLMQFLKNRRIYNAGSVGQPFGSTLASYIILEGALHSKIISDFQITFVTVDYDRNLASQIALHSEMGDKDEYAKEILTGVFRGYNPKSKIMNCL